MLVRKVLVSIDEGLLRRVDRVTRARGLTRSAYLAGLAADDLAREAGPGADPAVHAALRGLDALFEAAPAGDSTSEIRAERDAR